MKGSSINEWLIQRDNDQLKQEVKVIIEGQKTTGEKENEKKDEDDDEKEEMLGEIDSMSMRKYRKLVITKVRLRGSLILVLLDAMNSQSFQKFRQNPSPN